MERLRAAPPRALLVALVAAAVLLFLARPSRAEEAFVLDNGSVLRGTVVREESDAVEIRLSGRGLRGTVTVERRRIVQRFPTAGGAATPVPTPEAPARPALAAVAPAPATSPAAAAGASATLPVPSLADEGFFERYVRRASNAVPADPGARAFLVSVALAVLTALVALGARMAEIDDATLGRCTVVALLLGAVVGLAAALAGRALRPEVALAVPVALLAWAGVAAAVFRCGIGRAVALLAFVLVAGALVVFTTGVVVTSV